MMEALNETSSMERNNDNKTESSTEQVAVDTSVDHTKVGDKESSNKGSGGDTHVDNVQHEASESSNCISNKTGDQINNVAVNYQATGTDIPNGSSDGERQKNPQEPDKVLYESEDSSKVIPELLECDKGEPFVNGAINISQCSETHPEKHIEESLPVGKRMSDLTERSVCSDIDFDGELLDDACTTPVSDMDYSFPSPMHLISRADYNEGETTQNGTGTIGCEGYPTDPLWPTSDICFDSLIKTSHDDECGSKEVDLFYGIELQDTDKSKMSDTSEHSFIVSGKFQEGQSNNSPFIFSEFCSQFPSSTVVSTESNPEENASSVKQDVPASETEKNNQCTLTEQNSKHCDKDQEVESMSKRSQLERLSAVLCQLLSEDSKNEEEANSGNGTQQDVQVDNVIECSASLEYIVDGPTVLEEERHACGKATESADICQMDNSFQVTSDDVSRYNPKVIYQSNSVRDIVEEHRVFTLSDLSRDALDNSVNATAEHFVSELNIDERENVGGKAVDPFITNIFMENSLSKPEEDFPGTELSFHGDKEEASYAESVVSEESVPFLDEGTRFLTEQNQYESEIQLQEENGKGYPEFGSTEEENVASSQEVDILAELEKMESPFVWVTRAGIKANNTMPMVDHLISKEKEFENVETNLFREMVVYLVLAYEHCLIERNQDAINDLNHCNDLLKKYDTSLGQYDALEHVINASLANVAYKMGLIEETRALINVNRQFYPDMDNKNKAMICALRACVLMEYSYHGNKLSLPFMKEALRLDPDNWEWNLYYGKLLGRLRRVEDHNAPVTLEQLHVLERAVLLSKRSACLMHLADTYKNVYFYLSKQQEISQPSEVDYPDKDYLLESHNLYKEAVELEQSCPYVNARCAKGLWNLPQPQKDMDLAEECIIKALKLAPDNSLVNHYAGLFYEIRRDFDKSLACLEKAIQRRNYPAELSYMSLKLKMDSYYSPLYQLDGMYDKYDERPYRVQTLCHKGFYFYHVEKNIEAALREWKKAIEMDPGNPSLKRYGNVFNIKNTVNIYKIMEDEIGKLMPSVHHPQNKRYLTEILHLVQLNKPKPRIWRTPYRNYSQRPRDENQERRSYRPVEDGSGYRLSSWRQTEVDATRDKQQTTTE